MRSLVDLAQVIRTKNSGPFELTLDIIFKDRKVYEQVKRENLLNADLIAKLYHVPVGDILETIYFDPAAAFKATMKRHLPCGDLGETDIYGAQQNAPLLEIKLPV